MSGDCDITAEGAKARTLVITSREDVEIANQVRALLAAPPAPPEIMQCRGSRWHAGRRSAT